MDEIISDKAEKNPEALFVISNKPDGFIFQTHDEILSSVRNAGALSILVPPKRKYNDFKNVLLPTYFEPVKFSVFTDIKFLLKSLARSLKQQRLQR